MARASVDLNSGSLRVDDREILLTPKEAELMYLLVEPLGRVHSNDFIITRVWGIDADLTDERVSVCVLIRRLREKVRGTALRVENRWGFGYRAVLRD